MEEEHIGCHRWRPHYMVLKPPEFEQSRSRHGWESRCESSGGVCCNVKTIDIISGIGSAGSAFTAAQQRIDSSTTAH